jgi:Ca-activated chloride channel homolog
MAEPSVSSPTKTKMDDLKSAVSVFLQTLGETQRDEWVGLASYSTTATVDKALTTDLAAIKKLVDKMKPSGWTDIGAGINAGRTVLAGGHDPAFSEKVMILMTDGNHNQATSPETAAQAAKNENIVIHTITFGADADQTRMKNIAAQTGGTFHHAPDGVTLQQVFRDLARSISTVLAQ